MRVRLALASALFACAATPSAAIAADPIMRLADVKSGMECRGLSVIRGTAVSEFRVDVIDVLRGEPAFLGPRILIRVSGPAVDKTGIAYGFSGSPMYCRDAKGVERVAGAISEGLGQYGNFVVLATPMEEVLGVTPLAPPGARKASALLRSARPLQTPFTVSGLSGPVRRAALAGARRAGFPLAVAPSNPIGFYPPYELAPGTSVAAGLSSGDLTLSAIGTVSYRDGDRIWAFGHPLEAAGRRSLPLLDAYVFTVIDNPIDSFETTSSYKLATAGRPVGTLTNDGIGAIAGRLGAPPPTIPLKVFARDLASGRTHTIRADVADERQLDLGSGLDLISGFALSDAIVGVLRSAPFDITSSVCVKIRIRQAKRPLGYCNSYFDPFTMLDDVSQAVRLLDGYVFGPLDIRSVSIRTGVRPGVKEAFILRARAPRRVRRGQRIRVRMRLQRSRAGRFGVSFPYRVPRSARPGRQRLTIKGEGAGGGSLEEIFEIFFEEFFSGTGPVKSIGELRARIAALGAPDGVRATLHRKGRGGEVVYRNRRVLIRGQTRIPLIIKGKQPKRSGKSGPPTPTVVAPPAP
jgi:hypothetical protein